MKLEKKRGTRRGKRRRSKKLGSGHWEVAIRD